MAMQAQVASDPTTTSTVQPVEGKVAAVLVCEHRPLPDGHEAKRPGQDTVYVATGAVNPDFLALINKADRLQATVKHDGTSCKIDSQSNYYRRRDVRDGRMPAGALPGTYRNDKGLPDVAWLHITDSMSPEDLHHLSAIDRSRSTDQPGPLLFWTFDARGNAISSPLEAGTYELVGPTVQGNPYALPEVVVEVPLIRKGKETRVKNPRHYLIRHGAIPIARFDYSVFSSPNPVERLRDYILQMSPR